MEELEELEYYAECRKPQEKFGWNFDGCQEFIPSGTYGGRQNFCRICDCHQSHHRKVVATMKKKVVEYQTEVVYTRCHKIHADLQNLVDGCQEFISTRAAELTCAACGCHKSFHRNEITTNTTTTTTSASQ